MDPFANKKSRLFWCVYLLRRMICIIVGNPYPISESEIDLSYFFRKTYLIQGT